jgi:hypothetical protein
MRVRVGRAPPAVSPGPLETVPQRHQAATTTSNAPGITAMSR